MSDEAEFGLKFRDDLSGPARKAKNELKSLKDAAVKAEKELQSLKAGFGKGFARIKDDGLKGTFKRLTKRSSPRGDSGGMDGIAKGARAAKSDVTSLSGAVESLGMKAQLAGTALVAAVGYAAYKFVDGTISAMRFKDESVTGLTLITRSAKEANKVFNDSVSLSGRLGLEWKDTVSGMQKLLAKGFTQDFAKDLIKGTADLKIVSPDANIGNLLLAIGQIKTAGKLQGDELNQLTEAGLNSDLMFQQLEKRLGKNRKEILKLKEAGGLLASDVLPAILDSIRQMTGKELGQAAEGAQNSFAGTLRKIEQLPERFFLSVANQADKNGLGAVLSRLWDNFGTESENFSSGVDMAAKAIDYAVKAADAGIEVFKAFGGGFVSAFAEIMGITAGTDPFALFKDPEFLAAIKKTGEDFGKIAGGVALITEKLLALYPAAMKFLDFFGGASGLAQAASGGGVGLGMGLIKGILSQIPGIREAGFLAGQAGVDGTNAGAGVQSPSWKTFKTGEFTGMGLELGVKERLPNVFKAANDVGSASAQGIQSTANAANPSSLASASPSAPASTAASVQIGSVTIDVNVTGADAANPEAIGQAVRREVTAFFEGLAIQGAA